jgi:hypothetical protein
LATGKAATTNPYSTALSGAFSNPLFGDAVSSLFGTTKTPEQEAIDRYMKTFG